MPKIVPAALSWESHQCGPSNKRAGKLEAIRRIKRAMIAGWSSFNSQLLPIQFGILDRATKLWLTSHARKAMIDNILTSQISVSERPRRTLLLGMFLLCGTLYSFMLSTANAQSPPVEATEKGTAATVPAIDLFQRAIRRNVPLPSPIREAYENGTRDFSGRPGPNYWQLQTDFKIDVSLDPATHMLSGSETIVIHNTSPDALDRIVLRLDHNIFRPMAQRGASVPAENTDGMVVTRIAINGADVDLAVQPGGRLQSRGQGEGDASRKNSVRGLDQTVATISLAEPIPPKSTASLDIDWHTVLPGGPNGSGHRMTQRWGETLFQPTQWFPRLAKYDDLGGWDTSPYLGEAEFYNNFGSFDVRIDVPAGWIVTGTGMLQNPDEVLTATARERLATVLNSDEEVTIVGADEVGPGKSTADGDRLVWHFAADLVNDFAWATAENYVWRATRATIPGKGPVPIHMVYLPERAIMFEQAGSISRHALEFYSKLWIAYPFPQLTLQDGPSAGMEYPMVVNSNQGAADHEIGHQWWPMMLGTNETWYGWMDEGLNVYMNSLSGADSRGIVANYDGQGQSYGRQSGSLAEPTMMWPSNLGGSMYGYQAYSKATLMLSMLGGIVGDDEVQRAMREYTEAWAFKHPSPWDFVFSMSKSLDMELGWFWYYWLWTTESVDGSIESVTNVDSQMSVTIKHDGEMPAPVVLKIEFAADGPELREVTNAKVLDDGSAIVTWPADVWFDGNRKFEAKFDFGERKIEKITLDPNGRFPDKDVADNVWPRRGD